MAAATLSGASLCPSVLPACLSRPGDRTTTRPSSCIAAFSFGPAKKCERRSQRGEHPLQSSFWGRPAGRKFSCVNEKPGKQACGKRAGGALQTQAVSQETASIWTAVYGLLLLGGGTSAYLRSGSKQSVISGAAGAALSGVAYYLEGQESTHQTGLALAFGYSLLFASVFGIRLFATKKPFPAAPLLALSLASAFVFASAYST